MPSFDFEGVWVIVLVRLFARGLSEGGCVVLYMVLLHWRCLVYPKVYPPFRPFVTRVWVCSPQVGLSSTTRCSRTRGRLILLKIMGSCRHAVCLFSILALVFAVGKTCHGAAIQGLSTSTVYATAVPFPTTTESGL